MVYYSKCSVEIIELYCMVLFLSYLGCLWKIHLLKMYTILIFHGFILKGPGRMWSRKTPLFNSCQFGHQSSFLLITGI